MKSLFLRDVWQSYEKAQPVLKGLEFEVQAGEIACLLGPSGCGKTTVLRTIAGFERIQRGIITVGNQVFSGPGAFVPPEQRRVGFVFQDFALFPHLTVNENIRFGLSFLAKREQKKRIEEWLERVGLSFSVGSIFPHELSGGQQQRVALARALAPEPEVVLLDEPFSNLDQRLRLKLSEELRALLKDKRKTAIFVTHNQSEALSMADYLGVMNEGRILRWASPKEIVQNPEDPFVIKFFESPRPSSVQTMC